MLTGRTHVAEAVLPAHPKLDSIAEAEAFGRKHLTLFTVSKNAALTHQNDPVDLRWNFPDVMSYQKDSCLILHQLPYDRHEGPRPGKIEGGCWLVENQHFGLMNQSPGQ